MSSGSGGRSGGADADLLRLWAALPDEDATELAALLGLHPRKSRPRGRRLHPGLPGLGAETSGGLSPSLPPRKESEQAAGQGRIWRVRSARWPDGVAKAAVGRSLERDESPVDPALFRPGGSLKATPPTPPIATWSELRPRLRAALCHTHRRDDVDVPRVVRALSAGALLDPIPLLDRTAWPARLQVWIDASPRHRPVLADQLAVLKGLWDLLGEQAVTWRVVDTSPSQVNLPIECSGLEPGTTLLVLGDLGVTAGSTHRWEALAQALQSMSVRPVALVPVARARVPSVLQQLWTVEPWQAGAGSVHAADAVDRLMVLAGPVRLLQPGLLRAIRQLLPGNEADVGTELDFWQDARMASAGRSGVALDGAISCRMIERFAAEVSPARQEQVKRLMSRWHRELPSSVRHHETLAWHWCPSLHSAPPGHLHEALEWRRGLARGLSEGVQGVAHGRLLHLGDGLLDHLPDEAVHSDPHLRAILHHVRRARGAGRVRGPEAALLPPGTEPRRWELRLEGSEIVVWGARDSVPTLQPDRPGSLLGTVHSGPSVGAEVGSVLVRAGRRLACPGSECWKLDFGFSVVELEAIPRPPWAHAWGRDQHGLYADDDFGTAGAVSQRFRYIPPGRFLMGSPPAEHGRYDDEDHHELTLTQGFWLADTPVTQALWNALSGAKNPSRFKGAQRPVDSATWNEAAAFCERLGLRLPTEAEWERACRADTTTATWRGDPTGDGRADRMLLDPIACFNKNADGQTHAVAEKAANSFGLYDMLGNVWEWCADGWEAHLGTVPVTDPPPLDRAMRVARGGSYAGSARVCRAACRDGDSPGSRWGGRSFRLARGLSALRSGAQCRGAAGTAGPRRSGEAEAEPAEASDDPGRLSPPWSDR